VHEILGHETNLQDRSGDQAKNRLEDELESSWDFFVQEAPCLAWFQARNPSPSLNTLEIPGSIWLVFSFYSFYQQGLCTYRCLRPETESKHIINHSAVPCNQLQTILLYRRWVQHYSNRCAEGLGRKIVLELCSYYTGVAWKESQNHQLSNRPPFDTYHVAG
jgi:hypothetical protein